MKEFVVDKNRIINTYRATPVDSGKPLLAGSVDRLGVLLKRSIGKDEWSVTADFDKLSVRVPLTHEERSVLMDLITS